MKKKLTLIILVLVCALALSACGCKHETWNEADCETPKTCASCGETEGAPLGHTWAAATCETPKTCIDCGKVEGEALGHAWVEADCETAKTCSGCALTEGEPLGHSWLDATTEAPKTCENCALTEGERIVTDPRFTTASTAAYQGKWGYSVDITGELIGMPNLESVLECMVILELGNDGTMSMYAFLEDTTEFYAYLTEMVYAELMASGIDREQADAAILEATGMTTEQYVDYVFSAIDIDNLLGFGDYTGVYYVEDGKLYSSLTWDGEMFPEEILLEGDTLTLIGEENVEFQRIVDET